MMKRIACLIIGLVFVFSSSAFAASSIVCTEQNKTSNTTLVKCLSTSHTDGTFTALTALTFSGVSYWTQGYTIAHAYVINNAANQPDQAGTITVTDADGQPLIGTAAGDTLTLSTSASGVGLLVVDRASSQRSVVRPLYITITDTQSGSATSIFNIYFLLRK